MLALRHLARDRLRERPAGWPEQDDMRPLATQGLDGLVERLGLHHHAGAAAKRTVIHRLMPVVGPIPQIVHPQIEQPALSGAPYDAHIERPGEHLRKQREHVNLHALCSGVRWRGLGSGRMNAFTVRVATNAFVANFVASGDRRQRFRQRFRQRAPR